MVPPEEITTDKNSFSKTSHGHRSSYASYLGSFCVTIYAIFGSLPVSVTLKTNGDAPDPGNE